MHWRSCTYSESLTLFDVELALQLASQCPTSSWAMLTGHSETQVCSRRTDIMAQLSCCGRYQLCAKVSNRLYFLKISQHSLLSTDDLLYFYMWAVRPLLECACPVWHTSLTKEQSGQIESIQKQAFRIIFNNNCIDYEHFCWIHQLQTLADRRSEFVGLF